MIKTVLIFLGLMSLASAEYLRNDNASVVYDTRTNLTWQDNKKVNALKWEEAIVYCEALTLGNYNDWRLPNYNEFESIIDSNYSYPAMSPIFETTVFEKNQQYWTSTSYAADYQNAWLIETRGGRATQNMKNVDNSINLYVRCVRGEK